jgi:ERCC4-type nuclease
MPAEAMLASVPGISTITARSLLETFGSLRAVLSGDPETWQRVSGVGPQRAAALRDALDDEWHVRHAN